MWGWTDVSWEIGNQGRVNPTYVGMDRSSRRSLLLYHSKPHVCGDGPEKNMKKTLDENVNPTYVGMDRQNRCL